MNHLELRNSLTTALSRLYEMEAFSCLAEFLQGELNVLYHLSQSGKSEVNPSILSDSSGCPGQDHCGALITSQEGLRAYGDFGRGPAPHAGYSHA